MSLLGVDIVIPTPFCRVEDAPGREDDFMAIYDREDAIEAAKVCPVCLVDYDKPSGPGSGKTIQNIVGQDDWDTYPCPGCRPEEYVAQARALGDREGAIQRMLNRAARDVTASRRL